MAFSRPFISHIDLSTSNHRDFPFSKLSHHGLLWLHYSEWTLYEGMHRESETTTTTLYWRNDEN